MVNSFAVPGHCKAGGLGFSVIYFAPELVIYFRESRA